MLFSTSHALVLLVVMRSDFLARVDYLLSKGTLEWLELALSSLLTGLLDHVPW